MSIFTEPQGATLYLKPYSVASEDWVAVGETPIDSIRIPLGSVRLKIEKVGYAVQEDVIEDTFIYDRIHFRIITVQRSILIFSSTSSKSPTRHSKLLSMLGGIAIRNTGSMNL
jgi:hypothetical protein